MYNDKNFTIEEVFNLAIKNHQEGKINVAQDLYNQVLKINPNHLTALNNIAIIFTNSQQYEKAKECYKKAIGINPNYVDAYYNLGLTYQELKDYQKALGSYEKAIEINPNYADAYYNLGLTYQELKDYQKALSSYEKVIEINPSYAKAYNNQGNTYKEFGEFQKAASCYEKAIEINPQYLNAHYNLGIIFASYNENQKAKECYEKAIEINPNHFDSYNNIASIFISFGEYKKAISCYKKALIIKPDSIIALNNFVDVNISNSENSKKCIGLSHKSLKQFQKQSKFLNDSVSLFRLKHDFEQAKYLSSNNYETDEVEIFKKISNEILNRKENKEDENNSNKKILLTQTEISNLLPFYKSDHIYKTKKISGSCINPNKNWQQVENEYFNSTNQIMYIDDFLSEESLIELRKFCLISKVWNTEYKNKYLGAFSNSGFISPIHWQITIDLQEKLPKLFGPHRVAKIWGFKYDSKLGEGINIHADAAIHNLNFWITPDEYNNNKNSGGLKVYDTPTPEDWSFADYNNNDDKIYKYLNDNNANCINIPYRFNRAVLFNSAYFHETDEIDFKDEYEGRRVNNTYLFGFRDIKKKKD